jgi:hypothetical protein
MNKFTLLLTFATVLSAPAYGQTVVRHRATSPDAATAEAADPRPDPEKVEPAAVELAKRAEAGDSAFVAKLMEKDAGAEAVADMIARIKRADVRKTFREHLEGRGPDAAVLNYHQPSHVQVELRKDAAGKWEVRRLSVCR